MRNDFNDSELSNIKGKVFPNVGGRLRLFHEEATEKGYQASGIKTEVIKYEDDIAVVHADAMVNGSVYSGIGMASKARDKKIFPAILELAETRAIARALRFAGYGVEYTGAEEMSHLNGKGSAKSSPESESTPPPQESHESQENHKEPSVPQEDQPSLKRRVWDYVTGVYPEQKQDLLATTLKAFIKNALARQPKGTEDDFIHDAILKNKDHFKQVFGNMVHEALDNINPDGPPVKNTKLADEYQEAKKELAEKLIEKAPDKSATIADERKLQAKLFMQMPDGMSVAAFNETIQYLLDCNDGWKKSDVYSAALKEVPGFIDIMGEYCVSKGISPGFNTQATLDAEAGGDKLKRPGDTDSPSKVKPTYSDFRKSWANLGWDKFNLFIIQNANKFKEDRDEYHAAVAKFDRLKVKNDAKDMCFPYLPDNAMVEKKTAGLDSSKSILKEEASLAKLEKASKVAQLSASYPEAFQMACNVTGYDTTAAYPSEEMMDAVIETTEERISMMDQ